MSVTIHNTPQAFTPSDNPVRWTFSSDQTAQQNFEYVVEVYINNVLVSVEQVFPENGIYAHFNAQSFASNACNIPSINDTFHQDALNHAQIKIKVIEKYGDPATEQASAEATNVTVWKAGLDDDNFVDWTASNYSMPGASLLWLTNYPSATNIPTVKRQQEAQRLMAITNDQAFTFNVRLFDSDDVLVAEALAIAPAAAKITLLNITPGIITSNTALTAANFTAASYYLITSTSFEDCRFDLDDQIEYEHYRRIHFLSELGSIESFTFALISRPTATIKSHGYRQEWGVWDGEDFNYTKEEGREIDFAKVSERKLIVESDWLFEDVQHFLHRNLFESPVIWEETLIGGIAKGTHLRRRKIMQTAWADSYNKNDTLFKEQITLGLPHKTSMTV